MVDSLSITIPNIGQAVALNHWQDVPNGYAGLYFITFLKNNEYIPIYVGSTNSLYDRAHEHYTGYQSQTREKYILWRIAQHYSATQSPLFFNYFYTDSYYQAEALLLGAINFPSNSDHNGGFMPRQALANAVAAVNPANSSELDVNDVILYAETFNIQNYLD